MFRYREGKAYIARLPLTLPVMQWCARQGEGSFVCVAPALHQTTQGPQLVMDATTRRGQGSFEWSTETPDRSTDPESV